MRIVDMQSHIASQYADPAIQWMDQCEIDSVVTLGGADAFGERLKRDVELFGPYPGRFIVFSNADWSSVNEEGFGRAAAKQLEEDVASGARGLKILGHWDLRSGAGTASSGRSTTRPLTPSRPRRGSWAYPF